MSTLQLRIARQRTRYQARRRHAERRGSTLLIVLVLMTMLASLGVIFYVFAAQERASANYYSDGAKVKQFDIDRDTLFDFGIRQLIEGPQPGTFRNSALSGRRHALLPNMLGLDTTGKKLDFSPYNGTPLDSGTAANWSINDSAGAHSGTERQQAILANRDPDYTYPDNNNVFLHYDGLDPTSGSGYRIIIPSFHRPQAPSVRGVGTWYSAAATTDSVLRPHPSHVYVVPAGQQPPTTPVLRYLTDAQAQALWGPNVVGFPTTPPAHPNLGLVASRTDRKQGVWGLSGPPGGATLYYEYDVDNDGDDVWEGVWLDLDFPPLEDSTGQLYVPMFSFTVKDADALLNLNVHGNMARVWNGDVNLNASPFRNSNASDPFISKSNQGIYPTEVNPLWALNRRVPVTGGSIAASDYDGAYGADPFFGTYVGNPVPENWIEAANRDWLYLLMGRYTQSPIDLVPGRWGEEHLLYGAINNGSPLNPSYFSIDSSSGSVLQYPWPGPGQTQLDDNGDTNKVTGDWFGATYQAFGKPLDYTGLGSYWASATPKLGNYGSSAGYPARWPLFTRYSSSSANPVQWPASGLSGTLAYGLFNDAGEMVIDGDYKKDEDGSFGPEEMRALFLNNSDFATTTGGVSRLTQLAPYNFYATTATFPTGPGRNTQDFRSKFTTRSWDRKQHSIGYNASRPWEFNYDSDGDSKAEFPPRFGTSIPYQVTSPNADVFRPVLRRLIEIERDNFDQPRYQLRLNLNQLLVGPNGNPTPTFPSSQRPPNIQLQYRPLTPHPDQTTLLAAAIGTQAGYPANGSFTSPEHQESWARKDRQLMARDFFALLYTLTWPNGVDPTIGSSLDPSNALYQASVRQLAQYAVNLVDSLDRDSVITRFEYDTNPLNGWNLNDDPYDQTSDSDRGEVFGVEHLDLTLSEALAVRTDTATSDLPFTQWNDMENRHFAYVELRNPGPNAVDLSTRAWRVEFGRDYTEGAAAVPSANMRWLQLRDPSPVAAGALYTIGSTDGSSVPGTYPSIMKVDSSGSAPSDWDNPRTPWIAPAQQALNLDLRDSSASSKFSLTDATGATVSSPKFLYDSDVYAQLGSDSTTTPLFVRLYRRLSPSRPFPSTTAEEADNPYVLVDEIALNDIGTATSTTRGGRLQFIASDPDIATKLSNLRSRQHAEPMSINSSSGYAYTTSSGNYGNTLSDDNTTSSFRNWQKVFDRDFASLGELLQVTLGGFSYTETMRTNMVSTGSPLGRAALPGVATRINSDTSETSAWYLQTQTTSTGTSVDASAEQMFLPIPKGATAAGMPRWYRFLDLVEVSTKMQASIPGFPNPVDYPRVPGKININTIRHPEALAALLDDPTVMRLYVDEDINLDGALNTSGEDFNNSNDLTLLNPPILRRMDQALSGAGLTPYTDYSERTIGATAPNQLTFKSWWDGLVAARDGFVDTTGGTAMVTPFDSSGSTDVTDLFLPGLPGSRPFRSFAVDSRATGTAFLAQQDTLLRAWPGDLANATPSGTANPRQLFELGTLDEHVGQDSAGNGVTTLDSYVRSRLLNKVMNNVTTRSNVFVVFASVKFFRATRDASTGAVQIGGPLKPMQDAGGTLPMYPPNRSDSGWQPEYRRFYVIDRSQIEKAFDPQTGGFNFRALIEFQQNLN